MKRIKNAIKRFWMFVKDTFSWFMRLLIRAVKALIDALIYEIAGKFVHWGMSIIFKKVLGRFAFAL